MSDLSVASAGGLDTLVPSLDPRPPEAAPGRRPAFDVWRLAALLYPQVGRGDRRRLRDVLAVDIADAPPTSAEEAGSEARRALDALWQRLCALDAPTLQTLRQLLEPTQEPEARLVAMAERVLAGGLPWQSASPTRTVQEPPSDDALAPLVAAPPLTPVRRQQQVDPDLAAACFAPEGPLAAALPCYEVRPAQVQMARAVAEALNEGTHLVVEAGTGVGKSLAYLVPAVYFATQNERRVVISTNTINLQEQLYHKDIPLLRRALPLEFRAAVVKGRSNYLCLRRWRVFHQTGRLSAAERRFAAKILLWLRQTGTGDRSELALDEEESAIWPRVAADELTCTPKTCPDHRRGLCPLARARRRAESAHLVIVNHALLLVDLRLEHKVLPEYSRVIVDEAHHLEEEATDQLGRSIEQRELQNGLVMLSSKQAPGRYSGLLSRAHSQLVGAGGPALRAASGEIVQPAHDAVEAARHGLVEFFDALSALADTYAHGANAATVGNGSSAYEQRLRVTGATRSGGDWQAIEVAWSRLSPALTLVGQEVASVRDRLEPFLGTSQPVDDVVADLETADRAFRETRVVLEGFVDAPQNDMVYWLAVRDRGIALRTAPLDVGALLQEQLFSQRDGVILTSATMQIGGSFGYVLGRLGLDARDTRTLLAPSPFEYGRQALLCVPEDMPEPTAPTFARAVAQALVEICRASGGQTLVLFTSHAALRTAHAALRQQLPHLAVLGHGIDGSRQLLLERFRASPRTVLLGTSSFWEGIDVIGDALSCLVIVKLPFSVPTEPVFAARSEQFADPFAEYALPQAALRLKQGFGRLIRSGSDRGVAIILDPRLWTKRYGQQLMRALPPASIRRCGWSDLGSVVASWLRPTMKDAE